MSDGQDNCRHQKNAVEEVRVVLSEYRGHDLVSVRIWANYDSADSEKRPTKKGVALRVEQLPELIVALNEAQMAQLSMKAWA